MSIITTSLQHRIIEQHRLAQQHAQTAIEHARKAGELLLEAKETVAHGEWLSWLTDNVPDISERTAQGYMRLARACLADPAKAQRVADLSLRAALQELAEPKAARVSHFDPFTFKQRLAEIDEDIDRAAARAWADFRVDTSGLSGGEQKSAFLAALDRAPANIPLRRGHVTYGALDSAPDVVFVESRQHPGYWHDIDLRHGSASKRPIKPLGLAWRFSDSQYTWTTAPDDGALLEIVEGAHA